jgi:UDP-N-acetylmuramoylalanine-D-glutamate ligase
MEKIAILGCGRSGNAAIELAVAHGMAPIVFDEKVEFIPSFPDLKIYKSPELSLYCRQSRNKPVFTLNAKGRGKRKTYNQ